MPFYAMLHRANSKIQNPRDMGEVVTFGKKMGESFLPVFTSLGSYWAFVKAHYTEEDHVKLAPLRIPLDRLADMAEPMEQAGQLKYIAFDPKAAGGGWIRLDTHGHVKGFCRYMKEVRPGREQVNAEAAARFGPHLPGSEAYEEAMKWSAPRLKKVARDAIARIKEREVEEGSGSNPARKIPKVGRNEPCPCGSGKKYKKCHGNPLYSS